jgi:hypothetical protein
MSLSQKIAAGVAEVVGAPGPATIHAEDGPHSIAVPLALATPMGIECDGFEFRTAEEGEKSLDDLKAWGGRLASRVTYLMEPLALLEADPLGGEVLLRSQSPTPRNGRRSFYEVRIGRSGALHFDRIAYDEAARSRRKVPCQFTGEVLERLVDDPRRHVVLTGSTPEAAPPAPGGAASFRFRTLLRLRIEARQEFLRGDRTGPLGRDSAGASASEGGCAIETGRGRSSSAIPAARPPSLDPESPLGVGPGRLLDEPGAIGQGLQAIDRVLVRILGVDRFPSANLATIPARDRHLLIAKADQVHLDPPAVGADSGPRGGRRRGRTPPPSSRLIRARMFLSKAAETPRASS